MNETVEETMQDVLTRLAKSTNVAERLVAASSQDTPVRCLDELACDRDVGVRRTATETRKFS